MKIELVILETHDLAAMEHFYDQVLQLPVKKEAQSFTVTVGNSLLKFMQMGKRPGPAYHFAFNIPSNKIEEAKEWVEARARLLKINDQNGDIANFESWHARSVYFLDPAGNIVELIARFDLEDNTDVPFSSMQVRNISEAGIVFPVEQFDANIQELMEQYPLAYFDKQPPLPQFRALGDDEGLFVCVPENRAWFPTSDISASIHPMIVYATVAGRHLEFNF